MHNQLLVSILINNYNYGRFLKEAIDSALNQSYQSIEVIVVDDGSTDDSREIISSYGDRVKAILKENGGQASAFNQGFALSQGEIICFLDSDDLFQPEKVETIIHDFQKDAAIGWHFHFLEFFGDQYEKDRQINVETNSQPSTLPTRDRSGIYNLIPNMNRGKLSKHLPFKLNLATSGMSFKRSLLTKILPMDEQIVITSDDYIKYAALGTSQGFISFQYLSKQRIHGNNAYTFKPDARKLRAITQVLTATNLKENFPKLSKFSNNLVVMAINICWWIEEDKIDLHKLIQNYLTKTTFLEKLKIYTKAIYYRYIHYHINNFILKR